MPKPSKQHLSEKMQERNPLDMRQQIIPVDVLATEPVQKTDRPNTEGERVIDITSPSIDTECVPERSEGRENTNDKSEVSKRVKKMNVDAERMNEGRDTPEEPNKKSERKRQTAKANTKAESITELSKRQDKPHTRTDASRRTVLQELRQGVEETATPHPERYSFEIYPHQKDRIKELQDLYQQKTGRKLSASRILREGLDLYLEKAFQLLNERV
jgi:hypothetical protein